MQFETRPVGDGVYEIRDVETGEQFLMNVNTMQTSVQLDELTRTALMAALEEFGIVMQDNGTYIATEGGSQSAPPERVQREQLSGKDAWDANFRRSGAPDWVTSVGGSWGSSPSGWNSGGWSPDPGPSQLYLLQQQGYNKDDAFRIMGGYEPLSNVQRQVDDVSRSIGAFPGQTYGNTGTAQQQAPANTGSAPTGGSLRQAVSSGRDMLKRLRERGL